VRYAIVGLIAVALIVGCGNSDDRCQNAGGSCEATTPGACLNRVAGDSATYPCGNGICCLPLSLSTCATGGGACVASGTCQTGRVARDSTHSCGNGAALECCLPGSDGGT
jgi:hypothetical protein